MERSNRFEGKDLPDKRDKTRSVRTEKRDTVIFVINDLIYKPIEYNTKMKCPIEKI